MLQPTSKLRMQQRAAISVAMCLVLWPIAHIRGASAEESKAQAAENVVVESLGELDEEFAESFSSIGDLHFTVEDRPGTFAGAARNPGLSIRGASWSTAPLGGLLFSAQRLQATPKPFSPFSADGDPFGNASQFYYDPDFFRMPNTRSPDPDSPALDNRGYSLKTGHLTAALGQLSIGNVPSHSLVQDVAKGINDAYSARAKEGAVADPVLQIQNASALSGLKQEDYYLAYKPGKWFGISTERNTFTIGDGTVDLAASSLVLGDFQFSTSQKSVDSSVTAASLEALGRKDLTSLTGTDFQDYRAKWQLASWLTLGRYHSEEIRDNAGNPQSTLLTQNTMDLPITGRTVFHLTDETKDTGPQNPGPDTPREQTATQTLQMVQSFGAANKLTLTRSMAETLKGEEKANSSTSSAAFEMVPSKRLSLTGDWSQTQHSENGTTDSGSLSVTATPAPGLSVTAKKVTSVGDTTGYTTNDTCTVSYGEGEKKKVTLTASQQITEAPTDTSPTTTQNATITVQPSDRTSLEVVRTDTASPVSPDSETTQYTTRTKLWGDTDVVVRLSRSETEDQGETLERGYFVESHPQQQPYWLQLGYETTDPEAGPERPAYVLRGEIKPSKTLRLGGGRTQREDTEDEELDSWDWLAETTLFRRLTLSAQRVYNKPSDKKATGTILPFAETYDPIDERRWSAKLALSNTFNVSSGVLVRDKLQDTADVEEVTVGFGINHGDNNRLELSYVRGRSGDPDFVEPDRYNTYLITYLFKPSDRHEISLTGSYTDDADHLQPGQGKANMDLTLKLLF